jgi:hypothetical protein
MYKILGIIPVLFFLFVQTSITAFAGVSSTCQQSYGSTQACPGAHAVLVDVQVQNPKTKQYEQNLGSDAAFNPNDTMNFKVNLTNMGQETAKPLTLATTYPAGFKYAGGPGTYNAQNRTTTLAVTDLQPGQTRSFYYSATLDGSGTNKPAVDCNNVYKADATIDGKTNSDAVQFCINYQNAGIQSGNNIGNNGNGNGTTTKGGQTVFAPQDINRTPKTGPELLALAALLPAGASGIILRNKASKR